jgi:hypothetical protein
MATQPTPGTTSPGDLYVQLDDKSLWLGVDESVEPSGSVLISDIIGTQALIAAALVSANSYTDTQILTRAPVVHTHIADDVTDFEAAVIAVVEGMAGGGGAVPSRLIGMYDGPLSDIGTGEWAGWQLCDGTNGTPDLRDKFVLGAGNRPPGDHVPTNLITADAGSHAHVNAGTSLTVNQLPAHAHAATLTVNGTGTGATSTNGGHVHNMPGSTDDNGDAGPYVETGNSGFWGYIATDNQGAHNHSVSVTVTGTAGGTTQNVGAGEAHTHTMAAAGVHNHGISALSLREALPYYILAFVKKL